MVSSVIDKKGQLVEKFKPAVYLDSSVIIDYWLVEGLEIEPPKEHESPELPHYQTIRELLKSEKHLDTLIEIRKKILLNEPKTTPVTSALAVLELSEWHAEAAFKQMASEVAGAKSTSKIGKKQLGDFLKKAIAKFDEEKKEGKIPSVPTSGIEILMKETWINPSFAISHGLDGLIIPDIKNFSITEEDSWGPSSALAYMQSGAADIFHVLFAQHLGCKYFASFDGDFKRVKEILSKEFELKLLSSPQELLATL